MSETTSVHASGRNSLWHYEANDPFADNAAQVIAAKRAAYSKKWPDMPLDGLIFTARRVEDIRD